MARIGFLVILGLTRVSAFVVTHRSTQRPVALFATKKKSPKVVAGKGFSNAEKKGEPDRVPKDGSVPCGCGSGSSYEACCGVFHSGAAVATDAEQILRSRYTAYMYRLPAYLVATTLKFNPAAVAGAAGAVAAAVLSHQPKAELRRAAKAEKEELLKFTDSYDFSDLAVVRLQGPVGAPADQQRIAFSCNLRSRDGGRKLGTESDFLLNNVVVFQETSIFQQVGGAWYYVEADGGVTYAGDSMADRFDSDARQAALAAGKASRQAAATTERPSRGKAAAAPAGGAGGESVQPTAAEAKATPAAAPAAEAKAAPAAEAKAAPAAEAKAAPAAEAKAAPAAEAKTAPAAEADPASEMQRLRKSLMGL